MTDRARELLERAMESLDGGFLYRLELKEEIRAYLAEPEPEVKREALSDEEINLKSEEIRKWNLGTQGLTNYGWFSSAVRFAEKHHGIGGDAKSARTEQEAKREQFSDDVVADSYSQLQPILGEYLKFKAGFRMAEKMHGIGDKHHGIGGGDE